MNDEKLVMGKVTELLEHTECCSEEEAAKPKFLSVAPSIVHVLCTVLQLSKGSKRPPSLSYN